MNLEESLHEIDRLQDDGALVFIKWDGERERNKKTVLIEKPGTDYLLRRDTDDLISTIRDGVSDYDSVFKANI